MALECDIVHPSSGGDASLHGFVYWIYDIGKSWAICVAFCPKFGILLPQTYEMLKKVYGDDTTGGSECHYADLNKAWHQWKAKSVLEVQAQAKTQKQLSLQVK